MWIQARSPLVPLNDLLDIGEPHSGATGVEAVSVRATKRGENMGEIVGVDAYASVSNKEGWRCIRAFIQADLNAYRIRLGVADGISNKIAEEFGDELSLADHRGQGGPPFNHQRALTGLLGSTGAGIDKGGEVRDLLGVVTHLEAEVLVQLVELLGHGGCGGRQNPQPSVEVLQIPPLQALLGQMGVREKHLERVSEVVDQKSVEVDESTPFRHGRLELLLEEVHPVFRVDRQLPDQKSMGGGVLGVLMKTELHRGAVGGIEAADCGCARASKASFELCELLGLHEVKDRCALGVDGQKSARRTSRRALMTTISKLSRSNRQARISGMRKRSVVTMVPVSGVQR